MTFVIADIHSEISKLIQLIENIKKICTNPKLIFIGDYIDKGEDALATLTFLDTLSKDVKCVFLKGNHEYCWLNSTMHEEYILKYGGLSTIQSFNCSNFFETKDILSSKFKFFFDNLVNYYLTDEFLITHSGIPDKLYLNSDLKNIDSYDFLFNRYDFIKSNKLYLNKYRIIFGHTGFYTPYVDNFKIGIDTSACYLSSQPLTAFCIDTSLFINSLGECTYLNEINRDCCPNIVRVKPWRTYE